MLTSGFRALGFDPEACPQNWDLELVREIKVWIRIIYTIVLLLSLMVKVILRLGGR